jgi:methylase of polypeptide subunit release factors
MTAIQTHQTQNSFETAALETCLFGPAVVRIQQAEGVWRLTPHGRTLGKAMAQMRHALVGKTAIEIGVGTGVHAIAALKLGVREIDVTDIDAKALHSAAENAARNGVSYRQSWVEDWMHFQPEMPYDLVLCNPPFCKAGTPDRRFFLSALIRDSPRFLRPGGHLLFVQSSMADFSRTEEELTRSGFYFTAVYETRGLFRDYYFDEPGFIEESRKVAGGFEEIEGTYIETLRVYLATKP